MRIWSAHESTSALPRRAALNRAAPARLGLHPKKPKPASPPAREAQIMPWSEGETESWEKLFPELAASLPAEEAETLTLEFRSELTRLRSTG